jgi:hypothetical protein
MRCFCISYLLSIWIYQMLMYSICHLSILCNRITFPCIAMLKDFNFNLLLKLEGIFFVDYIFLGGFFKIKKWAIFYIPHLSDSIDIQLQIFMFKILILFNSMTFFINNEMLSWTLYLLVVIF